MPPSVLLEAHVGINLDHEQRSAGCVVHEIPGSCPNRDDGSAALPAVEAFLPLVVKDETTATSC